MMPGDLALAGEQSQAFAAARDPRRQRLPVVKEHLENLPAKNQLHGDLAVRGGALGMDE